MPPRHYLLDEANYRQLSDHAPTLAVLPWGATEAHNYHLPHGTDTLQATSLARDAAGLADAEGARVVVLPAIPFGNNEAQLDQVATISITTATATAILDDVTRSLCQQGVRRLLIINAHGGNEHKPIIRDIQARYDALIVLANFWQMLPERVAAIFDEPGDHAGELETSFLLHVSPELVELGEAGPGQRRAWELDAVAQPGVWAPRPWSRVHPDTGSGDPRQATAAKGQAFFDEVTQALARVMVHLATLED
ncbi:MAG: creatininase family protein [Phycisphaeraceae bacterium]